jgi:hypothetical protein
MSKRLREMDEKLNSILASILEIKQDIQKIKEMLVEIQNAIARLETTLKQHTVGGFAQTAIAKIEESYDFLGQISGCTYVSPETLTEFRNDILSTTSGVKYAMGLLHKLIMGEPGFGEGLLQIMTDSIIQDCTWRIPEYGDVFEEKVIWYFQSFEDFYSYLYLVQIQGIDLIMNAHYYRDESELVKSFLNEFQPKLEAQVEKYLSCVERLVFNVHPSPIDEFPNIGPIPDRAIALESVPRCEYYPNYNYNFTLAQKHLCQFLPRADYVVDRMLRGAGCFTARVLYDWGSLNSLADGNVQPSTYYGPFLRFVNNETMYMFDGHGSLSRPVEATYNRLWAGGVETPYGIVYYSRYKWTNIPVGNYALWDPDPDTRLFTPGVSDGYTSTGLVCSYDWHDCYSYTGLNGYKLAYGVMLSRGDFLVVEHWEGHPPWDPLSLTPWAEYVYDNFIEVRYDKNGFPYGYWAGFWHQGINYDPMA